MTDELEEPDHESAVSEQEHEHQGDENQKMVPLSAMLATRKKLQDAEARAIKAEAVQQAYETQLNRASNQEPEEEYDPRAIVEYKDLQASRAELRRSILEEMYQDSNPGAVQEINKYLKPILEKKPWLASSVDSATNRYARAHEIVRDYMHLVEDKPVVKPAASQDGKRIIQNANKPGSPVEAGKSFQPKGAEYLRSIQGKKEFREYRKNVRQGAL